MIHREGFCSNDQENNNFPSYFHWKHRACVDCRHYHSHVGPNLMIMRARFGWMLREASWFTFVWYWATSTWYWQCLFFLDIQLIILKPQNFTDMFIVYATVAHKSIYWYWRLQVGFNDSNFKIISKLWEARPRLLCPCLLFTWVNLMILIQTKLTSS